jgi:uncharacterized protein
MLDRDSYPEGVPCWVDSGRVDAKSALDFYGGLFGWEFENRSSEGQEPYYVGLLGGRDVAAIGQQPEQEHRPVWNTYVLVDDADAVAAKAVAAGGAVQLPPFDIGEAGRMAVLADTTGAAFCVWQANTFNGARAVNEPNTWNFSDLFTREPDKAMRFYNDLFDWTASELEEEGYAMIYRPGYGEFLAQSDPELYERLEGFGADRAFADVVASLNVMKDGQFPPEAPSHWGITFAVEDADATAAKAKELGGTVTIDPFDTQWTRTTIVADPDGCVFTASQFTPPGQD